MYVLSSFFTQLCVCFKEVGKNLAPSGTATQSSTIKYCNHEAIAQLAINGNTDDRCDQHSCMHTDEENEPWWKVTFNYDVHVSDVLIVNRGDCCGKFLIHVIFPNKFPVAGCPAFINITYYDATFINSHTHWKSLLSVVRPHLAKAENENDSRPTRKRKTKNN